MDRASDYGSEGWGFESLRARWISPVKQELARLVAEQEARPALVPETKWGPNTTVNDAIAAWRDNGWEDLSPKTRRHYESIWKVHIEGSIGRRRIASLNTYDVESFYRSLKAQGLSQATIRQVRAVLHRACRLARKWSGGILHNPAEDADLPLWQLEEQREPVRAPSAKEVRALIDTALEEDIRLAAFLRLLAATGLRRGEACALRWADIDPVQLSIKVNKSVVVAKGGAILKAPKTRASIRHLACDTETMNMLCDLRKEQEHLARACGETVSEESFVFSFSPDGFSPPHPDSFSHAMARHYTDALPAEDRRAAEHIGRLLAREDPGFSPKPAKSPS